MSVWTDNFNRANGGLGSDWGSDNGTINVLSNQAAVSGAVLAEYVWITNVPQANQYSQAPIAAVGSGVSAGVTVRWQRITGGGSGYLVRYNATQLTMYRMVAGASTPLTFVNHTPQANDIIRLEVDGTRLTAYINGIPFLQAWDNAWSAGYTGLRGSTGAIWDDFEGGDLPANPTSIFVGATTNFATASGLTLTGTLPSSTDGLGNLDIAAGDTICMVLGYASNATISGSPTINGDATGIVDNGNPGLNGTIGTTRLLTKIADGTESGGAFSATITSSSAWIVFVYVRRGCQLDTSNSGFTTSATQPSSGLNVTRPLGIYINVTTGRGAADSTTVDVTTYPDPMALERRAVTSTGVTRNVGGALTTAQFTQLRTPTANTVFSQSIGGSRVTFALIDNFTPDVGYQSSKYHPGQGPLWFRAIQRTPAYTAPSGGAVSASMTAAGHSTVAMTAKAAWAAKFTANGNSATAISMKVARPLTITAHGVSTVAMTATVAKAATLLSHGVATCLFTATVSGATQTFQSHGVATVTITAKAAWAAKFTANGVSTFVPRITRTFAVTMLSHGIATFTSTAKVTHAISITATGHSTWTSTMSVKRGAVLVVAGRATVLFTVLPPVLPLPGTIDYGIAAYTSIRMIIIAATGIDMSIVARDGEDMGLKPPPAKLIVIGGV